jgi:energy-coupling factor transport system permease protein
MRRAAAVGLVLLLLAGTAALVLAPVWACALVVALSALALRTGRRAYLAFVALTLPLHAALFALTIPGGDPVHLGPIAFGLDGARAGLAGAIRLASILGLNLAAVSWVPVAVLLDGLRLPARATAFLGAVLIAANDLGRDAVRLVDAQRLDGRWPHGWRRKAKAAAGLLAPLAVLALRRAQTRAEALRLAGHDMGPRFAPLVAVTAMAVAARLALTVALPNISLTYAVVFVAGLVFGARVGALAGLLGMAFTDLLLTGLHLVSFANAPAMALVGVMGGLLRGVDFTGAGGAADRWAGRLLAASCGLAATVLFSVAADVATWALVPDFRGTPGALRALVLAGLAFNAIPAVVNAVVFAAAVGPVAAAARAAGVLVDSGRASPPPSIH